MPKLIRILAVSACSGFLVGAGIRAGQKLASRPSRLEQTPEQTEDDDGFGDGSRVEERLDELERRVAATESVVEARERQDRPLDERISRIESQVAGHSAALTELRECSLRNEETMRRLLGSLERLIEPRLNEPPRTADSAQTAARVA